VAAKPQVSAALIAKPSIAGFTILAQFHPQEEFVTPYLLY
jgi:hypothetical protein